MYASEEYEQVLATPDSLNVHRHPVVSANKKIVKNRENKDCTCALVGFFRLSVVSSLLACMYSWFR